MGKTKVSSGVVAGILLPMGLICLFAFCSLALALMGGRAYKQIQNGIEDGYGSTVAASYLRTKLSQNNTLQAVSLRTEGGVQVLVIEEQQEGQNYETRIFVVNGELKETFVPEDTPFSPTTGVGVAKVRQCYFELARDGLFTAEIVSEQGSPTRMVFALAGGDAK